MYKATLDASGFHSGAQSINSQLGMMGSAAGVATVGLVALTAAVVATGAAFVGAVAAAASWQTMMTDISKTTGVKGEELEALSKTLEEIRMQTGATAASISGSVVTAGSIGIPKEELAEFAVLSQQMAGAFRMSSDAAAEGMGKIGNVIKPAEMSWVEFGNKAGSVFNILGDTMATSEAEIMTGMTHLGSTMSLLKPPIDTLPAWQALVATVQSLGLSGDQAGEAIQDALTYAARNAESKDLKTDVAGLLGISNQQLQLNLRTNAPEVLKDAAAAIKALPLEQQAAALQMFGSTGSKAVGLLMGDINSLTGEFTLLDPAIQNANVAFEDGTNLATAYGESQKTVEVAWQRVIATASVIAERLGGIFLPGVGQALNSIADLGQGVADGISNVAEILKTGDFKGAFDYIVSQVVTGVNNLGSAIIEYLQSIDYKSIGDTLHYVLQRSWYAAMGLFKTFLESDTSISGAFQALKDVLEPTFSDIFSTLKIAALQTVITLGEIFTGMYNTLGATLSGIVKSILYAFADLADTVGTYIQPLLDKLDIELPGAKQSTIINGYEISADDRAAYYTTGPNKGDAAFHGGEGVSAKEWAMAQVTTQTTTVTSDTTSATSDNMNVNANQVTITESSATREARRLGLDPTKMYLNPETKLSDSGEGWAQRTNDMTIISKLTALGVEGWGRSPDETAKITGVLNEMKTGTTFKVASGETIGLDASTLTTQSEKEQSLFEKIFGPTGELGVPSTTPSAESQAKLDSIDQSGKDILENQKQGWQDTAMTIAQRLAGAEGRKALNEANELSKQQLSEGKELTSMQKSNLKAGETLTEISDAVDDKVGKLVDVGKETKETTGKLGDPIRELANKMTWIDKVFDQDNTLKNQLAELIKIRDAAALAGIGSQETLAKLDKTIKETGDKMIDAAITSATSPATSDKTRLSEGMFYGDILDPKYVWQDFVTPEGGYAGPSELYPGYGDPKIAAIARAAAVTSRPEYGIMGLGSISEVKVDTTTGPVPVTIESIAPGIDQSSLPTGISSLEQTNSGGSLNTQEFKFTLETQVNKLSSRILSTGQLINNISRQNINALMAGSSINSAVGAINSGVSSIVQAINELAQAIAANSRSPLVVGVGGGGGGGSALSYASMGMSFYTGGPFAEGGYVDRPTIGLFGEAGPEYIVPESDMQHILSMSTTSNLSISAHVDASGIYSELQNAISSIDVPPILVPIAVQFDSANLRVAVHQMVTEELDNARIA